MCVTLLQGCIPQPGSLSSPFLWICYQTLPSRATSKVPLLTRPACLYACMTAEILPERVPDKNAARLPLQVRFPTTIHVHGLLYNKSSEGSPYNDGTSGEYAAGHRAYLATKADLLPGADVSTQSVACPCKLCHSMLCCDAAAHHTTTRHPICRRRQGR